MLKTWRNNFELEGGGRWALHPTDLWTRAIWCKKGCFFVGGSQHFCNWLKLNWSELCEVSLRSGFDWWQAWCFWSWIVTSKLCFFSGASELFSASEGLFSLVFGGREYQGIVNHSRCIMFFSKSFWSKFKYFWHQLSKEKYNYHCMTL